MMAAPVVAMAAPYAAMVIDARNGKVLHSRNADTRLHPASLTKMMTLYIAFEAVENGEIGLDQYVTISKKAAAEPPSKLGLRAGQRIKFRYLIRGAAVKSANDAATAIGEAIEGSEAKFARRMNRTAKALGMSRTTFKNAHGLTEDGHLSTARDMTTLGQHLLYDYPEYYNLFSRLTTDAGVRTVPNTNRRLLNSYRGADGIKTGYTRAAGFNLVASAERGGERVIATVFGGRTSVERNARVAELLDMGFKRAPSHVAVRKPKKPVYGAQATRVSALKASLHPKPRPAAQAIQTAQAPDALLETITKGVETAVKLAQDELRPTPAAAPVTRASSDIAPPPARPGRMKLTSAALVQTAPASRQQEVVTRMSSSGGRHWGINVGRYGSRYQAERVLLKTALQELGMLDDALRKVVQNPRGFDANFVGLTEDEAAMACRRLAAHGTDCKPIGPTS
ncbi:D-alanyl-D-alanine carboxypeptidase family protein [Rhodovulum sp. P5]|uniref:D-alanyl-D-alanine carboxypeptidase family protein n=1 Tax=Rhodovulum sp. P5 TaxID=1564506 RepID=UPI0009DAEE99|nr:D-alanyl-D-alanine carboxypeptidase family protein [Rhodovulum sp. P5]